MNNFVEIESFCMGTNVIQRVYGENAEKAIEKVIIELERLEDIMSFYRDSSEISKLNKAAGESEVYLSEDTFNVIKKGKMYSEISRGTFDITAAPLIKLWGVFTKNERVPSTDEIDNVLNLINYRDILIDKSRNSAKLLRKGQKIDLGGIAKGYAADRAIEIYKENGIKSAFINIGGNILVLGDKPDKSHWNIGLQDPFGIRGEYIGVISVSDKTVVTSGDYVRYFERDNIRYHHILDPRTGYPANSGVISATIIANKSVDADALSTAIFILGIEEGTKLIEEIQDVEAIFVTDECKVYVTDGARENFVLTDDIKFQYMC